MKRLLRKVASKALRLLQEQQSSLGDKALDIEGLSLLVNQADAGGRQYQGRQSVEEVRNLLYPRLAEKFRPEVVIDVGANYGFTASIFARYFPDAELVLVEPDPKLGDYIRHNMQANGVSRYRLIQGICSDKSEQTVPFGINPASSQDNRVRPLSGWHTIGVSSVTLSEILSSHQDAPVFIKVDTQGFETQVFKGAEDHLSSSSNWFVKSEFAPYWLESQNNSPEELLEYLVSKYRVIEAPARTRFCRDTLKELFESPLRSEEVVSFVKHVRGLNSSHRGWVDIYVGPQTANKALE